MKLLLISIIFYLSIGYAQYFREFPKEDNQLKNQYPNREKVDLLSKWQKFNSDESEASTVNLPFLCDEEKVVLKKKFKLTSNNKANLYVLVLEGVNNLREVYVNDNKINFDNIDLHHYELEVSGRIIRENDYNTIKLVLTKKKQLKSLDYLSSNVFNSRDLVGVYGSIYLMTAPRVAMNSMNINSIVNSSSAYLKLNIDIMNNIPKSANITDNNYQIKLNLIDTKSSNSVYSGEHTLEIKPNSNNKYKLDFNIGGINLWSPTNPYLYKMNITLSQNGVVIDEYQLKYGFKDLKLIEGKFRLNNQDIAIKGVTYLEDNGPNNLFFTIDDIKRDIALIKGLGANAIRILSPSPNKRLIDECDEQGLLVFLEINDRFLPEKITENSEYQYSEQLKLNEYFDLYFNNVSVAAIGLKNNSEQISELTEKLFTTIKRTRQDLICYLNTDRRLNVNYDKFDLIGLNLLGKDSTEIKEMISFYYSTGKKFLVSSLGYRNSFRLNDGYKDPYSLQQQAKYLSSILNILDENQLEYFIHTFADYRLDYHSIFAGEVDNTLMGFGLVNEYRDYRKQSYSVVKSYISNEKLPIIVQGTYSDKTIVIFVIFGIATIFAFVLLTNSTRRFREYAIRSITRSYNFFADIRDQRIFSIYQTTLLAIIISGSISLIYSGYFYYLKDKTYLELFISIFNSKSLIEVISFIAWKPLYSLGILTGIIFIKLLTVSLIIKLFNLFIRNKIYFSHAYIVTTWAFLPFIISLPLGVVLYQILEYQKFNSILLLVIGLFHLWSLARLIKGISIVYDVRKSRVYIYFLVILLVIAFGLGIYFESSNSTISYFNYFFISK